MKRAITITLALLAASPVAAGEWGGFYGGAQIGYLFGDASGGLDGEGAIGGLHVGYDFDLGDYVFGGELDYDTADVSLDGAATIEGVTRLKLRGGWDLGQTLIYGTAGAARVDTTIGDDNGYFLGAGLAYDLGNGLSAGSEILWHDFDNIDGAGTDAEATTISARLSFRF